MPPYKQEVAGSSPAPPMAPEKASRALRGCVGPRLQPRCNPATHQALARGRCILLLDRWRATPAHLVTRLTNEGQLFVKDGSTGETRQMRLGVAEVGGEWTLVVVGDP
jgi:hypothetical protein